MRKISLLFILLISAACLVAQEVRPVKNVIVMIPDGTSVGVYSAARWYKFYNKMGDRLFIDPYFTGTVTTLKCPIGDSAHQLYPPRIAEDWQCSHSSRGHP